MKKYPIILYLGYICYIILLHYIYNDLIYYIYNDSIMLCDI